MVTIKSKIFVKTNPHRPLIWPFFKSRCADILFISIFSATLLGCGGMLSIIQPERFTRLPAYQSQKRIIWQGYRPVPTPDGPIDSVFFGYHNHKNKKNTAASGARVDILEFKRLNEDGTWQWSPYLIFSDDNFDGSADRLFIDLNADGNIDSVHDVSKKNIVMVRIRFDPLLPLFEKFMRHQAT